MNSSRLGRFFKACSETPKFFARTSLGTCAIESLNKTVSEGGTTAVVTTRQAGKNHSYQLFFEGDTDATGDMGFVADCRPWVAPHLPFLPETRNYPPCKKLFGDVSGAGRWPLIDKGKSMQFVLKDQSIIKISRCSVSKPVGT
jgi:hypothetical protein